MEEPYIIKGGKHTDSRGVLSYINGFDLSPVRRFYTIEHPTTEIVRGWRGHKIEQRWFSVVEGIFLVKLVQIDDWKNPNPALKQLSFTLSEAEHSVLHVPKGFASSLQALVPSSKILVFADSFAEDAIVDDYLFPTDYFTG
jgi:dTDP-4-dehydrorhamnose 3,5-epimerase